MDTDEGRAKRKKNTKISEEEMSYIQKEILDEENEMIEQEENFVTQEEEIEMKKEEDGHPMKADGEKRCAGGEQDLYNDSDCTLPLQIEETFSFENTEHEIKEELNSDDDSCESYFSINSKLASLKSSPSISINEDVQLISNNLSVGEIMNWSSVLFHNHPESNYFYRSQCRWACFKSNLTKKRTQLLYRRMLLS